MRDTDPATKLHETKRYKNNEVWILTFTFYYKSYVNLNM